MNHLIPRAATPIARHVLDLDAVLPDVDCGKNEACPIGQDHERKVKHEIDHIG